METTAADDIINIIWIDPNIDNKENKYYLDELNKIKNTKVSSLKKLWIL